MEIGRRIARKLREHGIESRLVPAERVQSLEGSQAVILGSAIYANKTLPALTALTYRWADELARRPTYLFCSGPLAAADPSTVALPPEVRERIRATRIRDAQMFGGAMWPDRLRPTERAWMRMWGSPPGDFRDWDNVDRWADRIAADILARQTFGAQSPQ
jgi:menaquinone-dependent protoporphyrinogen oxidase